MPKIAEFDAGNLRLQPSEIGVESTAAAGRRLGGFFNQIAASKQSTGERLGSAVRDAGDAGVQQMEHAEVHRGAASLMGLIQGKSQEWNDIASHADPNDPSIGQDFVENNLNPALEKFQSGFLTAGGSKWAETRIDAFRQHMAQKTTADMSSLAADAVHINAEKSLNSGVGTVYNDPSSLGFVLGTLNGSIGDMADTSPNLTPEARAKIKNDMGFKGSQELVHAAIAGTISKGGDWESIANNPKYAPFINRAETETFAKAAKAQQKADFLQQKQLVDWQHTELVRDGTLKLGKVFSDNVTYDETGKPVIKPDFFKQTMDIVANNATAADHARTMLNWGEAQQNKKIAATSDPATKQSLLDRFTSNNPPTEVDILKAQATGKLSNPDGAVLNNLRKALEDRPLKDPIYKATMDGVKGILGTDPIGHEKYASFFQTFVPAYLSLSPDQQAKALDINDPNSLLSKTMAPLKRTPQQMMVDRLSHGMINPSDVGNINFGPAMQEATGVKPNGGVVQVKSKDEASKLPKGTQFQREGDPNVYTRR